MTHITREQSRELVNKTISGTATPHGMFEFTALCNAAIEWHIAQQAKVGINGLTYEETSNSMSVRGLSAPKVEPVNQKLVEALEDLKRQYSEHPDAFWDWSKARAALDMYKKDQKTNTSQERVQKTAESMQVDALGRNTTFHAPLASVIHSRKREQL